MKYVLKDEDGKVIAEQELNDEVQAAAFEKAGFKQVADKKNKE
ncbi:hypothetical protein [Cohnella kolymensis]|nr:hypothetical protein [Cohnella kolymensis]